jgi:UDP-N-acetylmuramoylalanine--D-glutamate ligase
VFELVGFEASVMDLRGKRVLVVGLGRSGVAAARLCLGEGATVFGTDARPAAELGSAVEQLGIELFAGGHDRAPFEQVDVVVVSPGVPDFPALQACEARGVPVIGELELGCRFITAPVLAVGGTNGKSTTTALLASLLQGEGQKVFAGGNLGVPLCEVVSQQFDALVLEVSSFQLERAPTFHPKVNVLLNITDDHLDRYDGFQSYANAKGNSFVNQQPTDFAVIPAGDPLCSQQAERGKAQPVRFALAGVSAEPVEYSVEAAASGGVVIEQRTGTRFELSELRLHGTHNALNAAAAIAAARCFGISPPGVAAGLRAFQPLAHRMALAGEVGGVRYYDDSKGTNVGAVVTALQGVSEPKVVLIAGGRDKLGSYEPLRLALQRKGRAAILIGEAAERIAAALGETLPVHRAGSMDEAVQLAAKFAQKGDAVLLSPACSSFDMFSGYAARGDAFVAAVKRLNPD